MAVINPRSVKVNVTTGTGMDIEWDDGHRTHFAFQWLRDACPCATCTEERNSHHRKPGEPAKAANSLLPMYKEPARPKEVKRQTNWLWASNPFTGAKEFQGMLVMMSLMNNWDLKDDNNRILFVPKGSSGGPELQYILSDLGATFGNTGGFMSRSRNKPEDFAKSKFVEGVEGNRVKFSYGGKNTGLFANITVEQAKWIGSWLSRLSDKQLSDAFRAANYTPDEVQLLTTTTRARINQIVNLR